MSYIPKDAVTQAFRSNKGVLTPNQIKAFVKKFQDKGIKLDAIVIDYLNLIHSTMRRIPLS